MDITPDTIKKVAHLARLGLTEEEIGRFAKELDAILEYVRQLQAVDTTGVEPTYQVTRLSDVTREDVVDQFPEEGRKKILNNAPRHDEEFVLIKRVK
jgi:aspartyl-tRNA(Asn)/glutamyl-tRNA(Gln) amidotransferase subunit C